MLALLLALWPAAAAADTLFYQPLNRDAAVTADQWKQLWQQAQRDGYRQVIVQWSAYGDERFSAGDWLLSSLAAAQQQGLALVIGLAADPKYFRTVQQPGWQEQFSSYWAGMQRQSMLEQQRLQPLLAARGIAVAGWYLPAELSDRLFQEGRRRRDTLTQLQELAGRLDRPLHVSAYSTGVLSPEGNASWLSGLEQAGLRVWWQDGEGTRELPAPVRQAYRQALPCAIGVVREAFSQVSAADAPFQAVPATPQLPLPCHPDAVFSLPYLPWAGVLRQGGPFENSHQSLDRDQ